MRSGALCWCQPARLLLLPAAALPGPRGVRGLSSSDGRCWLLAA
jgi:hypothetical protein